MNTNQITSLLACASLAWVGCTSDSNPGPEPRARPSKADTDAAASESGALDPDTAPVVSVDRFQDGFATLFKRSAPAFNPSEVSKVIPEPNAPIDMDNFLIDAFGPAGERVVYYSLDILPEAPTTGYLLVDKSGKEIPDQLPIIDSVPGDEGYNDFVRVTEVQVNSGYVANTLTSFDDVDAAVDDGTAKLNETARIENWAVVPRGTTAKRKFPGSSPVGYRAWMNDEIAHYLRFDTNLELSGDKVPTSPIIVIFKNDMSPAEGFLTDDDGKTHNVVATLPGQPGYSSYWDHSVGKASGFDDVKDLKTALANVRDKAPVIVNCPIVE